MVPSSVALSLGLVLGPYIPLGFLFGSVFFLAWSKRSPASYQRLGIPIASGMIAGEGLAGILQGVLGIADVRAGFISTAGCYGFPC